jgi:trigger factor
MEMNLERLERSQARITFQLSAQDVDRNLEHTARDLSRKVKVPGFRPGRAPSKVIEARVGKDTFRAEAIQKFMPVAYQKAVTEHKLATLGYPRFEFEAEDLEWGKDFSFQVTMDLQPEIQLASYKDVSVQKRIRPVEEEDIQGRLKLYLDRYSELVPSEKTTVANGDYAIIDMEGKMDDEVVPGSTLTGYPVQVGQGYLEQKIEQALEGMKIGDNKVVSIEYPEDHPNNELSGKAINFSITLTGIQEREYPELDDDFAKDVSGFDTLDEWKEQIRADLETTAQSQAEKQLMEDLIGKVIEESTVELPPFTLEEFKRSAGERLRLMLAYQGIQWEDYEKALADDGKDSQEVITSIAEKEFKEELVLLEIGEAEKLEPSTEELEAKIAELEKSKSKEEDVNLANQAYYLLRLEKARQFIRDHAKVEEELEKKQEDGSEEDEHTNTHGGGAE